MDKPTDPRINGADYVLTDLSDQAHVDHVMRQARDRGATVAYWDNRSDPAAPGWVLRQYRGGDYDEIIIGAGAETDD